MLNSWVVAARLQCTDQDMHTECACQTDTCCKLKMLAQADYACSASTHSCENQQGLQKISVSNAKHTAQFVLLPHNEASTVLLAGWACPTSKCFNALCMLVHDMPEVLVS